MCECECGGEEVSVVCGGEEVSVVGRSECGGEEVSVSDELQT